MKNMASDGLASKKFNNAMKDISAGFGQAGSNAGRKISRSARRIGTGRAGGRAYAETFKTIKSIRARELMDSQLGSKAFKQIHKSMRHLKTYDGTHLEKLQKRYEHSPRKLDKQVTNLAERFAKDIETFAKGMETYLGTIEEGLTLANEKYAVSERMIILLLHGFARAMEAEKVSIPGHMTDKIRKKIMHIERSSEKSANKGAKASKKAMKGAGSNRIIHHVHRMTWHKVRKKLGGTEEKKADEIKDNINDMKEDIKDNKAKLSFLVYLEDYLDNKELLDRVHAEICMDFLLMIENTENYYVEMSKSILEFEAMFRAYDCVKEVQKDLVRLKTDHERMMKDIEKNITTQHEQYTITKETAHKALSELNNIERLSKEHLKVDMHDLDHLKPAKPSA